EILYKTGDLQPHGVIVFDGIVFANKFVDEHPELVLAYLKEYARITEIYRNDPGKIVDTLVPFLALPRETAIAYVNSFHSIPPAEMAKSEWMGLPGDKETGVRTALRKQAEFLHSAGQINQVPQSFEPLVNRTFLAKMVGA